MPDPAFWLSYMARSLVRGGRRTVFAVLCVAVGVAGVVALQIAALTVQNALTSNVRAANGGDISVTSDSAPLSTADLSVFRRLQSRGRISAWTAVSTVHATTVGTKGVLVPFDVQVVTSPPYPLGGQPTFSSPPNGNVGTLLSNHGDVLVTSVLAQELGVGPGSRLVVNSIGGRGLPVVVRGVLSETSFSHAATMIAERRDAAALGDLTPHYTSVYVNLSGPPGFVAGKLRTDFPSATVQTVAEALQADEAEVHDFRQFMLMVGLLALLVAGIGTLNAIQSMLGRRRLEIAMLKAMGFRPTALAVLFGGEAILIGLAGGVGGTAAGVLASRVIVSTLADALAIQVAFILDAGTLAAGVVLGVGAALIFAVTPIARAAAFRPLELLREGTSGSAAGWARTVALVPLVLALFAALAALTLGDADLGVVLVLIAFAAFVALSGGFALAVAGLGRLGSPASRGPAVAVLLALAALSVLAWRIAPAVAAIVTLAAVLWAATIVLGEKRLLPLTIAVRALARRRARSAVTLVAFLAGVLAMSLTLTVAISLRQQINTVLAANNAANLIAIGNQSSEGALLRATRSLPGIRARSHLIVLQTRPAAINGRPLARVIGPAQSQRADDPEQDRGRLLGGMTGFDLSHGAVPRGIDIEWGRGLDRRDAGTNHVLVRAALLNPPYSLRTGDRVTLRDAGTGAGRTVEVVGFYGRPRSARGFASFFTPPVLADRSLALSLGRGDAQVVITLSADPKVLTHDATTLQRRVPGALVIDVGDLAAIVDQILNELLDVLAVITALVLGAGLAVVGNGVALAMMERRRELALFKAIGFGPDRVLQFILVENALIGTLAGAVSVLAVAVALGLLSHLALQQAIGFDPRVALVVMLGATALAVAVAYITARSAVRARPLEALRNE